MKFNCPNCSQKLEISSKKIHVIYLSIILLLVVICSFFIWSRIYWKDCFKSAIIEYVPFYSPIKIPADTHSDNQFAIGVKNYKNILTTCTAIDWERYKKIYNSCLFVMYTKDIEFVNKWFLGQYIDNAPKIKNDKELISFIGNRWKVDVHGMKEKE